MSLCGGAVHLPPSVGELAEREWPDFDTHGCESDNQVHMKSSI